MSVRLAIACERGLRPAPRRGNPRLGQAAVVQVLRRGRGGLGGGAARGAMRTRVLSPRQAGRQVSGPGTGLRFSGRERGPARTGRPAQLPSASAAPGPETALAAVAVAAPASRAARDLQLRGPDAARQPAAADPAAARPAASSSSPPITRPGRSSRLRFGSSRRRTPAATNPARGYPLLLMTDQEGGEVKRLPGAPDHSEKWIGSAPHRRWPRGAGHGRPGRAPAQPA